MWNSLRFRLTVIFIGLAIIPLLAVGAVLAERTFTSERDQAIDTQRQVADRVAAEVQSYLRGVENDLSLLGSDIRGTQNLDHAQEISLLLTALNSGSYRDVYEDLILIDDQGTEQLHVSRAQIVTSQQAELWTDKPEFEQPKASGQPFFGSVTLDDATGESYMNVSIPLHELRSINLSGVLLARLRFKEVGNLIATLQINSNQTVYVVDPGTQIVAQGTNAVHLANTPLVLPAQDGDTTGLSGANVILATNSVQIGAETLLIVAERLTSDALALAQSSLYAAVVITAIALVVAIALVWLTVRQVVRPVEKLSEVAHAIQKGDFSVRSDVRSQDEIGQLGLAFNEMAQAIQVREKDLLDQAAELRVATARAREAARVKGEFLANVSHELRTPLNAIIGFSDMLLVGMNGPLNEKQQHKMERLKENGSRLLALINDLLDLTRIDAGRIEMVEKPYSPRALAERISAQMESLAVESNLVFETRVDAQMPELIMGDEKRIEQVAVNLLSNAFKFTKEGSVTLSIDTQPEQDQWTLSVTDTGIGVPPHAVNIIFEEFRQLDGSYSRAYRGSGLGLAITRNLVRMMGGKISVKSIVGSGSTFIVELPLNVRELTPVAEPMAN